MTTVVDETLEAKCARYRAERNELISQIKALAMWMQKHYPNAQAEEMYAQLKKLDEMAAT
jgi:hypothetical protein